jgi:DNA excision repair protein ERCC-6
MDGVDAVSPELVEQEVRARIALDARVRDTSAELARARSRLAKIKTRFPRGQFIPQAAAEEMMELVNSVARVEERLAELQGMTLEQFMQQHYEEEEEDKSLNDTFSMKNPYAKQDQEWAHQRQAGSSKRFIVRDEEVDVKKRRRGSAAAVGGGGDDADINAYRLRLQLHDQQQQDDDDDDLIDRTVWKNLSDSGDDVIFDGGFVLPACIYDRLYSYQRTGVRWLWELHKQNAGGIIGDEMGLGKTIQVIALLAGIDYGTQTSKGPVLIVCPASMLYQWKMELLRWYPFFRIIILHDVGNHSQNDEQLIKVASTSDETCIVLSTYAGVRIRKQLMNAQDWNYVILDEGHIIRNPDAQITLVCKRFRTSHRLILSGTPIQNRLKELWSLFDFIYPGKLGTLPVFEEQFCIPIVRGGYTHASSQQVRQAFDCATLLRSLVLSHILRRTKDDVQAELPQKNEHVLFCYLTDVQRKAYQSYLDSREMEKVLSGDPKTKHMAFKAITHLRKICNHPDLLKLKERESNNDDSDDEFESWIDFGNIQDSCKMKVLEYILKTWKSEGHKVLLFSQTKQMLDIIESYINSVGYSYRRMDGSTSVKSRGPLMDEFNRDDNIFIFLLTTRTGGVGVNLVGANRVIIFDPDWNPSTDEQARERVYRIGQKKDVTIYRLITRGTIEEKVYHRQIFKKFLSNKILKDPTQKSLFSASDLLDLFQLNESSTRTSETEELFSEVKGEIVGSRRNSESFTDTSEPLVDEDDNDSEQNESEKKLITMLFGKGELHGAFEHDKLVNHEVQTEEIIEKRASRIAEKALEALKQSRELIQNNAVGVPTWTGKSGSAGFFLSTPQKRFGNSTSSSFSSQNIISSIKDREHHLPSNYSPEDKYLKKLKELQSLLSDYPRGLSSEFLFNRFETHLTTPEDQAVFKKILKKIANFEKDGGEKKGVWILKDEFLLRQS